MFCSMNTCYNCIMLVYKQYEYFFTVFKSWDYFKCCSFLYTSNESVEERLIWVTTEIAEW